MTLEKGSNKNIHRKHAPVERDFTNDIYRMFQKRVERWNEERVRQNLSRKILYRKFAFGFGTLAASIYLFTAYCIWDERRMKNASQHSGEPPTDASKP